jgi:hypothetical protein
MLKIIWRKLFKIVLKIVGKLNRMRSRYVLLRYLGLYVSAFEWAGWYS